MSAGSFIDRCIAFPDDLDAGGPPRTSELRRALLEELSAGTIWDEWGTDANIVVNTQFQIRTLFDMSAPAFHR